MVLRRNAAAGKTHIYSARENFQFTPIYIYNTFKRQKVKEHGGFSTRKIRRRRKKVARVRGMKTEEFADTLLERL